MTEQNREREQREGQGQDVGSSFGAGQQSHGGYGQGSYGYGQGQGQHGQDQDHHGHEQGNDPGSGVQQGQGGFGDSEQQIHGMRDGGVSSAQRSEAPRDDQRTDEGLREMIRERLMEDSSVEASDVEVHVHGGLVTLEGSIDSRMAKYQIEDMVEHMGVSDVHNNLRVSHDKQASGQASSGQTSQSGSSGGVSSLGMSSSGTTGVDRTSTGDASSGSTKRPASSQ